MKTKKQMLPLRPQEVYARDILWASIPLVLMAVYMYGLRVLIMLGLVVATAKICDWLAAALQHKRFNMSDNTTVAMAVLFALLLPASCSYYVLVFGVAFMALLGKYAFGNHENLPFNLAALALAVVAVGWPNNVFLYPSPGHAVPFFNVAQSSLTAAPSAILKIGGIPQITLLDTLLGNYAGPMGATYTLVIVACFGFLLMRGRAKPVVSGMFILGCGLVALVFPRVVGVPRLTVAGFEIFSGALIFAAVFIVPQPTGTPKGTLAQAMYGLFVGGLTMACRYYGIYELGVCFAIIMANSLAPFFEKLATVISGPKKGKKGAVKNGI